MPPREVYTLASSARNDGKGAQRQQEFPALNQGSSTHPYINSPFGSLPQDSQSLPGPPAQAPLSSPFFAPQQSNSHPAHPLPLLYSECLPQDSQQLPGLPAQNPSVIPLQSDFDLTFPSSIQQSSVPLLRTTNASQLSIIPPQTPDSSSLPAYSSPVISMQQNNFGQNHSMNAMRSAPARGFSSPQPPAYVQQNMAPPDVNMMHPNMMQSSRDMMAPPPMQAMPTMQMQTTQPTAAPSMDVRNVKGLERKSNGEREWSHGCCDFCNGCGTCMLGFFCPCIVYSQIKTRMSHLETRREVHPDGGETCSSDCFVHGFLTACCGIGWVLQIGLRGSMRDRYRISGNGCGDCMMAACCTPCELTQESRELELEERALLGTVAVEAFPPSNNGSTFMEKR